MADLRKTMEALQKNEFEVKYVKTAEDALQEILKEIPSDATVGAGGSMTVVNAGILDALVARGNQVFSQFIANREGKSAQEAMDRAMFSDYYLSSSNAITERGELVNIDGRSNRVAALCYGPKKVIIVAGKNKIVANRQEAFARIRNTASPLNTKRLNSGTPCMVSGKCENCDSLHRICRATLILERPPFSHPVEVILVDEDLGF